MRAKRRDDAWGTMRDINPELYTEKGEVQGAIDMSLDEDTFEITLNSVTNTAILNIDISNIGEENSILKYSVFCDTRPAGVYIDNGYGNITVNESSKVKINIYGDYLSEGDHVFTCTVNSNNGSISYNIIIHKDYGTVYQEWYDGEDKVKTVLQKPQLLTRYTYTGREYNRETGQYYYRARTYVSGIGRFTGKDPWTWQPDDERIIYLNLKNTLSIISIFRNRTNSYFYLENNSMIFIDPFGYDLENTKAMWSEIEEFSDEFGEYVFNFYIFSGESLEIALESYNIYYFENTIDVAFYILAVANMQLAQGIIKGVGGLGLSAYAISEALILDINNYPESTK